MPPKCLRRSVHTPRLAHLLAVLVMLTASASVMRTPEALLNPHTPGGPYDHFVLDSLDAGLAALLPEPVYQVTQQVMRVIVQPAEAVKTARQQIGIDEQAAKGNQVAAHASSILDGVLFVALIAGSVVGVIIRAIVRLARDKR